MFFYLLTVLAVISSLTGKPIVVRNVTDCSITEDGILHYRGQHSFTKFEHECLSWNALQTIYTEIINEPNFFNDASIIAAKNYCRNPNMNVNGPWCFIEDEDDITMEQCDVCQSLAPKPTLPTNVEMIDEVVTIQNDSFFQRITADFKRCGTYIREKFWEFVEYMQKQYKKMRSTISDHFNF